MIIDPSKFLPQSYKNTRWVDVLQVVFDLLNDIRVEKVDIIKTQYQFENMSDEDIKDLAKVFGNEIISLDGYTSDIYYLKRQLLTLIPRILSRNTPKCYNFLFLIYNLTGTVYPTYLSDINGKLEVIENWYTVDETSITYETLDQGADFILFNLPYSMDGDNFILDVSLTMDPTTPVLRTDKFVELPTTTLDELLIFPHLDMVPPLELLTRHIVVQYTPNFIENESEFLSSNTMLAFWNDLLRSKKATEVLYIEPNIKIDTTRDKQLTIKEYRNYDDTITTNMESILIADDLSTAKYVYFGTGGHEVVDNTITNVTFPVFNIDLDIYSFQNKSVDEWELIGRKYMTQKNKIMDFSELVIYDESYNALYYAKFPKVRVLSDKLYSNIHLEIRLTV